MRRLEAFAMERCFPELPHNIRCLICFEIKQFYQYGWRKKPFSLSSQTIKVLIEDRSRRDRVIKLLFDIICSEWEMSVADVCKKRVVELKTSFIQKLKDFWKWLFIQPVSQRIMLKNYPDVMEAIIDDKWIIMDRESMHISILNKHFRVQITISGLWHLVVEAEHKDDIQYGTYWPFKFAQIAFRKKIFCIQIALQSREERRESEMERAMDAFLKKFERKTMAEGWKSSGKDDVNYTKYTSFTQGRHFEVEFSKITKWSTIRDNWGYIV